MKRFSSFLLVVLLIISMAACTVHPPGSNGPSKPTAQEPPVLKITDGTGQSITAGIGTHEWNWDRGDGTWTGVCADSTHPLEWQEFLTPLTTEADTIELSFAVQPQSVTVHCWSDAAWGDVDAIEERVSVTGSTIQIQEGGYVFEVIATWTGEDLAAYGTVCYGFYVVREDHNHTLAEESQTVDDPVTGYCGNTMTTITKNGREYTFMGGDSVNLTDVLINLRYDPMKVCRCLPEFTVTTELGGPYGVNLSQGYARCSDGQADLTEEQVVLIWQILNNQT